MDSNIVLCNKEMKILSLLHSIDVRHRKLNVGFNYELPPLGGLNIFEITLKDLLDIKLVSTAAVRWIGRTLGLPTKYAEEIMKLANINPQSPGNSLSDSDIEKIFSVTKLTTEKVVNGIHEPLLVRDENKSDVLPFSLGNIENKNCTSVTSFMEGLDLLFTENLLEDGKTSHANSVAQKIEEFEHRLEEQTKAILTVKQRTSLISAVAKSLLELSSMGVDSLEDPKILQMFSEQNTSLAKERGILFVVVNGEKIKINHAEIVGSPFFLLKNSSDNTFTSVTETAHATVCFSRAWREGLYGLNAYWVNPDQIKTAAPSGQFIAKGSFIIEGARNFVKVTTLQLSVGLYQKGDSYSLMCGPSNSIKKNCIYYVTIEPSGHDMVEA